MGSPYFLHSCNNVINVKSLPGLERAVNSLMSSAGVRWRFISLLNNLWKDDMVQDCETAIFHDIMLKCYTAYLKRARVVLFAEARYEWTGWEKFQSAIVVDFTNLTPVREQALGHVLSSVNTLLTVPLIKSDYQWSYKSPN